MNHPILLELRDWKIDLQVAFWRGFFSALVVVVGVGYIILTYAILPTQEAKLLSRYEIQVTKLTEQNEKLTKEASHLTGVVVSTFGKDARKVVEEIQKKGGHNARIR